MNPSTPTHTLSGWKDIANYLGKGVRTVQRYEGELRLPVRRPAGKARGSVVATKAELDAWVAASPIREELHKAIDSVQRPAGSLAGVTQNLHEMRMLREQMRELRSEIKRSVSMVRASIVELHGRVEEKNAPPPVYEMIQSPAQEPPLGKADDFAYPKAS